jgi:hypothetical protein
MGFLKILNIKWKIIIMLIIVQKQVYFQYIKTFSLLHVSFFDKEQWTIYFTFLTPQKST